MPIYTTIHTPEGAAIVIDDGFGPNDDNEVFYEDRPMELLIHTREAFDKNFCIECKSELICPSTQRPQN
jgi:hypothetical protein